MATKRRQFTAKFKAQVAMEALRGDRPIQTIAAKHAVHPNQVSGWKRQAQEGLLEVFARGQQPPASRPGDHHPRPAREDRRVDRGARFIVTRARALSGQQRRMMIEGDHPSLSLSGQCRLLALSRSTLYYQPEGHSEETLALMRRIDELYLNYPFYVSRQMVRHLAREGVAVGRHRVRRLMKLLGLEAIYRTPRTTVANPEHRVYPYLLSGLAIERPNHVWCADITYIPVQGGFLYWWRSWTGPRGGCWRGG